MCIKRVLELYILKYININSVQCIISEYFNGSSILSLEFVVDFIFKY